MSSSPFADRVLQSIAQQEVQPFSKGHFAALKILNWIFVALLIFISGHSFGLLLYIVLDFDFSMGPLLAKSSEKLALLLGISFWLVLFFLGLIFGIRRYRKTPKGYRMEAFPLMIGSVFLVTAIGWVSYRSDFSHWLDQEMGAYIPKYEAWESVKLKVWSDPEAGLLAGTIEEVNSLGSVTLVDFSGKRWQVDLSSARVRPLVKVSKGAIVKLIGSASESGFLAEEVRPWRGLRSRPCLDSANKQECIRGRNRFF